ncbi:MAG: toll/interleukin-1 receptor domain-containing protein [Geminicoccaceae bacterium]
MPWSAADRADREASRWSGRWSTSLNRTRYGEQAKGVRCWFAPHDVLIGAKILDTIDEAIRLRDKVLLVLSEGAIASDWVEDEVTKAFAEERQRKLTVLVPIRIDSAVLATDEAWAVKLHDSRNIGGLSGWKEHDAYTKGFNRLLRAPKAKENGQLG